MRLDEGELVQVISGDASFDYPWSVARRVRVSIEDKPLMVSMNINRDPIALDPQYVGNGIVRGGRFLRIVYKRSDTVVGASGREHCVGRADIVTVSGGVCVVQ